jgi:hypothetical protein
MLRLRALAFTLLLLAASAPGAAAAPPAQVDPATLTPPPNPNYDWDCTSNAGGIDCWGVETFGAIDAEGFSCGAKSFVVTFTQTTTAHRVHDAQGRVLWNHFVVTFDEAWRLDGTTGPVLRSKGRVNTMIDYAVPGDPESRTIRSGGASLTVSAPGEGVIFENTGRVVTNWDESEVLSISGQQDFYEDFDGAIAAACAAVGA